jgi:hypothetical protein
MVFEVFKKHLCRRDALYLHENKSTALGLKMMKLQIGKKHLNHPWMVGCMQVGCYYMCTRQYEQARRYFGKATGLEPNCAAAWIAFGHAFSAQDERDQVIRQDGHTLLYCKLEDSAILGLLLYRPSLQPINDSDFHFLAMAHCPSLVHYAVHHLYIDADAPSSWQKGVNVSTDSQELHTCFIHSSAFRSCSAGHDCLSHCITLVSWPPLGSAGNGYGVQPDGQLAGELPKREFLPQGSKRSTRRSPVTTCSVLCSHNATLLLPYKEAKC